MNGRALNDRAIEVAPSSSRVCILRETNSIVTDLSTDTDKTCRFSIVPLDSSLRADLRYLLRFRRRRIDRVQVIGHVHLVVSGEWSASR